MGGISFKSNIAQNKISCKKNLNVWKQAFFCLFKNKEEFKTMNGIDVSYVQKNIDWQKVKKVRVGIVFNRIEYGKEIYVLAVMIIY